MKVSVAVVAGLFLCSAAVFAQSTPEPEAYARDMQAMTENMKSHTMMKSSGDPDKDFIAMMIPHHQGAIDMARLELNYGKDPMLKAMAEKIISDQEKEISQLRALQARHK